MLTASSVSNAVATFYQGDALHAGGAGLPFGDGLSCASGTIVRIASRQAVGNAVSYPTAGELSLSVRGALPPWGGVRTYQAHYRNAAAFCTSDRISRASRSPVSSFCSTIVAAPFLATASAFLRW